LQPRERPALSADWLLALCALFVVAMSRLLFLLVLGLLGVARAQEPPAEIRFSVGYVDRSVEPGENFYRYACGGWLRVNRIPPDKTAWGPWQILEERVWHELRAILEQPGSQVAELYASGMDVATRDRLGFAPIADDLTRIVGLKSAAEIAPLLADLHTRGSGVLFAADVSPDAKQSAVYALDLWQSSDALGLPDRDYYLTKQLAKERDAYRAHIGRMLVLTGDSGKSAARQAETILRLETALAKLQRPREELQDSLKNYTKLTVAELAKSAPHFAWSEYCKALGAGALESVVVGQPEYLAGISRLLKSEPLDDWKTYLRWHVISDAAPYLHAAADREHFAFYGTKLNGQPEQAPLWRRVTRTVDDHLGEALGQLYCARHFPESSKARVEEMVRHFHAAFRERLGKVAWMSDATRTKALGKLERFFAKVGHPEKYRDYSAVEIRRDDYFGNVERATQFEWRRKVARLGQPVDRAEWYCSPPTVNAFFMPTQNSITLPAGILQPPMFDPALDDAVNYGNIGATIGHEMTHGFDSDGRQYDADGSLNDWWTAADATQFETRAQKIVEQFNGFTPFPKMHVNGKLTLAENIADLGGLLIAWDALQKALAADPAKRQSIDGFTPEQRFFISYAQSWCVLERSERVKQSLLTDEHAPAETRANGPLMHLPEFYEAFGVKKGSKMWLAPEKRAVIW
jgi:putative endopeptidase